MVNSYSQTWFKLFLETQPYTEQEVAFITRYLPNPPYSKVLDIGCGPGRHTQLLAERGYEMVGIDLDEESLAKARHRTISTKGATYIQKDMRQLEEVPGTFDAMLSLWQSFGYFDDRTNRDMLRQISQKLNPQGRLILDIYHRGFFERYQGTRQLDRRGFEITATNTMHGNRLVVQLDYGNECERDMFEWQLFTPEEICQWAVEFDLHCLLMCTECDEQKLVTPEKPRMNLVFERSA
jgi:SAM-dependent methyltransferase